MMRYLTALALLTVAGGRSESAAAGSSPDPLALVGWWRVDGTEQVVLLDPARVEIRDGGRTYEGTWRADPSARFLAQIDSMTPLPGERPSAEELAGPRWLTAAAGFAVDGQDHVLRDRDGAEVARLRPEAPGAASSSSVDPSRAPSQEELRALRAGPAPAGMRAAGPSELVGHWIPDGYTGPVQPSVTFAADGTWTGTDGCNKVSGSWIVGADGGFLATASSVMTLVACDGVDVGPQVAGARLVTLDEAALVLLDAEGRPLGRFRTA